MARPAQRVEMIPIDRITIVNPRLRSKKIFKGIVENIAEIGLKRPITVTSRQGADGPLYDLVCGQGRLEAYIAAGENEIPSIIKDVSEEDAHIMSLVENIARRNSNALELLQSIKYLKEQGYGDNDIAEKTNLTKEYIRGIVRLLDQGEDYLVGAVENGRIPLYHALKIATEDDSSVQMALAEAYESGTLPGKNLFLRRRLFRGASITEKVLLPHSVNGLVFLLRM